MSRDPDLYLFEDVDSLDRATTGGILFAWKPTQLNTFLIGASTGTTYRDEPNDPELENMAFYIKYKRAFRF